MSIADVPYEDRAKPLTNGFTLIWPFRNLAIGSGPYEVFLDNNALARSEWLAYLKPDMHQRIVLNPTLAWAEQWLSNPKFRANAAERITDFVAPFVEMGFSFPAGYAETQARSLAENDSTWRTQWMLVYLYVVLLYRIIKAKKGDYLPEKLLTELKNQEVPMFNGCIMLCSLGSYLRANQAMRLVDDNNAAYSYLNSFISLHGSGKGESEFDSNYLRNRAGDMSLWCALGALFQNGFQPVGEPVLLTQDKALTKLILRCFPGYLDSSRKMMFTPDERVYAPEHRNAIIKRIKSTVGIARPITDRTEQLKRLNTLRAYVKQESEPQLSNAIDQVWDEWMAPGFNVAFK